MSSYDLFICSQAALRAKEDDGMFIYTLRRNRNDPRGRYDPYDLQVVSANTARKHNVYYTASASGVSKASLIYLFLIKLFHGSISNYFYCVIPMFRMQRRMIEPDFVSRLKYPRMESRKPPRHLLCGGFGKKDFFASCMISQCSGNLGRVLDI